MTKFKLYEDILSRSWNRYFYDVEANTIEERLRKLGMERLIVMIPNKSMKLLMS